MLLASGSADNTVRLWDVTTGVEVRSFIGHPAAVNTIAFSPDGKLLGSGSYNGMVKLWDVATGNELRSLTGNFYSVNSIAFSPDGKMLASASDNGMIRPMVTQQGFLSAELIRGNEHGTVELWDVATGAAVRSLTGHARWVETVAFSPNGRLLASGDEDGTIKLWDVTTGAEVRSTSGHSSIVYSVTFSPDGRILASGGTDDTIKLWDVATGRNLAPLAGHTSTVSSIAFSPDGGRLASGSWDKTVKLWDVATRTVLRSFSGHSEGISSVAFSPDGKKLASGSDDRTIKLWDVATGARLRAINSNSTSVYSMALSKDGRLLATGGGDAMIRLWDAAGGGELRVLSGHSGWVDAVAISPNAKLLASSAYDGSVRLWDIRTGVQRRLFIDRSAFGNRPVAFSPDGKTLASGAENNTIRLWSVATGARWRSLRGHTKEVASLAFNPDGKILASSSWDKTIRLWDASTGVKLRTLIGHTDAVESVAYSPDGKMLASAGDDKTVTLWDAATGAELVSLVGHPEGVRSIAFSPDGKLLASAGDDGTIKVWDVSTRAERYSRRAHSRWIRSVTFSPDGKMLFSSSADTKTTVWDAATGREIASLIALDESDWIAITPEGRFDTSKSLDGMEGLHWIVNSEILKPLPLEVFMRQYYEPGLLQRVLRCNRENRCGTEFKPLPSVADLNRVQPKVTIREIVLSAVAADSVDVTVEIESITEAVTVSADGRAETRQFTSGAYDLRLFRDGQLVGMATPKAKLALLIGDAPRLVAETRASGRLLDTPEDRAWREANDIFKLQGDNIKSLANGKLQYTFRNIKLPKGGRKEVAFTAYAFNSDRVKSTTTPPAKFNIPSVLANAPKRGRAFLISIGVNASENPAYDLRYAANDARKIQEVVGERLKADSSKYSEVISISLISDYDAEKRVSENKAQKEIIRGVFSLLAGDAEDVRAEILSLIPNRDKIKAVEPEDTLIITYAGHGYADQSGIFYLLPYDIGADTRQLNAEVLKRIISSDELSLWMRDIAAAEMIMIIDACYSSAAVQGDGFKPGPMGSRGLGQLAYDKDMKILSATQADNIALELGSLEQGLLTYALIQDAIIKTLADTDRNKQLLSAEWLSYAEKRVPELYQEVRNGKRNIVINGRNIRAGRSRAEVVGLGRNQKSNLSLQRPSLFDFKRRSTKNTLFILPHRRGKPSDRRLRVT